VSKFPQLPRTLSSEQGKLFRSHLRELADPDEPRLIECLRHLRPDTWEPLGFQRAKEITLTADATSRKQDGFFSFEATAFTSLLLAIPSETEIFRLWPMAVRMTSAISRVGRFRLPRRSK
jgi:hypothetical protein